MGIGLEDRGVLLSVDAISWRFNVIDSTALDDLASEFNMILDGGGLLAFCGVALEGIVEDVTVKPVGIVDLDRSLVCGNILGGFQMT